MLKIQTILKETNPNGVPLCSSEAASAAPLSAVKTEPSASPRSKGLRMGQGAPVTPREQVPHMMFLSFLLYIYVFSLAP